MSGLSMIQVLAFFALLAGALTAPALADPIIFGSTIANRPNYLKAGTDYLSQGGGDLALADGAGLSNVSRLTSPSLMAALTGCATPNCAGDNAQYGGLSNTYKYFAIGTVSPGAAGDLQNDSVLPPDELLANEVPEPASLAMLGLAALVMLAVRRRVAVSVR